MIGREFKFHNGAKGSALAIRVIQKKSESRIDRVLRDGTVIVNLAPASTDINHDLKNFIAGILDIDQIRLDIIAGHEGPEKLLSILDMRPNEVQKSILEMNKVE